MNKRSNRFRFNWDLCCLALGVAIIARGDSPLGSALGALCVLAACWEVTK